MNALDLVEQRFHFEAHDPRPSARVGKNGPDYSLTFKVDKDTHDAFMAARQLKGMVIEGELWVVHQGSALAPRPYSHIATELFRRGFFHRPEIRKALGDEEREKGADTLARELAQEFGHTSISQVSPQELVAWLDVNGIDRRALPIEYRPGK